MVAPELSAVVLCYREGAALVPYAEQVHAALTASGIPFELVLVANYHAGSDDPTPGVARAFAEEHDATIVVARAKEGAMGWDFRSGLAASSGRVMVVIDGDGQFAAHEVLRAYHRLRDTSADVLKGRRTTRADGLYRRIVTVVYNCAFALLFPRSAMWDVNAKPKALTREAYERLDLRSDDWFVDAELVLGAHRRGLRVVDLPVAYRPGQRPSHVKSDAVLETARHMFRYRLTGRP